MRKSNESQVRDMIHNHGWDWKKYADSRYCPHCRQLLYKTDNLPFDGAATIGGIYVPIEIKEETSKSGAGKANSFSLSDIRENQHAGLTEWRLKHGRSTWIFLTMGHQQVNAYKQPYRRRSWLVPWSNWLTLEDWLRGAGYFSLPYSSDTTNRKALLERGLTAVDILLPFEVPWSKWENGYGWAVPREHVFALEYDLTIFPSESEM